MGVMVPVVCVGREEGVRGCWGGGGGAGGFHSDTKAMKRLDQWSVQWVPVCVCVCVCTHARFGELSSIARG